jgi:hypothetical protein
MLTVTVTVFLLLKLPDDAEITVDPFATAVTNPLETVAALVLLEFQTATSVMS